MPPRSRPVSISKNHARGSAQTPVWDSKESRKASFWEDLQPWSAQAPLPARLATLFRMLVLGTHAGEGAAMSTHAGEGAAMSTRQRSQVMRTSETDARVGKEYEPRPDIAEFLYCVFLPEKDRAASPLAGITHRARRSNASSLKYHCSTLRMACCFCACRPARSQ